MGPGLYLKDDDGALTQLEPRVLGETADLQPLLARAPQLLAGDDDDSTATRYLLVERELGIVHGEDAGPRWSVDHLFLDQEGVPTLVEVKHSSNTEIRRQIVGQILEYASNFTNYWTAERIRDSFEARCRENNREPSDELLEALGAEDVELFWTGVDDKISARRLRLVFVADAIPSELRQIIEFLNEELRNTEVLGVEIREHAGDRGALVTARTIGSTEHAQVTKGRGGGGRKSRRWTESDYLASVLEHGTPEDRATLERLIDWAKRREPPLTITFGTGMTHVGMQVGLKRDDAYLFPFTFFNNAGVEVNFQQMANVPYPPFHRLEMRKELQQRLQDQLAVQLPDDRISLRPNFPIREVHDPARLGRFIEIFEWSLSQAEASGLGLGNLEVARAELQAPTP
jgi:hypothetical protein